MTGHGSRPREDNKFRPIIAVIGFAALAYSVGVLSRGGVFVLRRVNAMSERTGDILVQVATAIGGVTGAVFGWRGQSEPTQSRALPPTHMSGTAYCADEREDKPDRTWRSRTVDSIGEGHGRGQQ